mgnify:CR=1 FL=1
MPVNDKIRVPDYNDIRNKLNNVMGTGSGNSGYGQTTLGPSVSESSRVTINEYGALRYDIINAWKHIYGSNPTLVVPAEGNTVRYDTDFAPSSNMALEAPNTQYNTYADNIIANRFTVHASQSATQALTPVSSTWPGIYGTQWTSRIQCTVTATWTSAAAARYFFNSGGQIRFSSSRSGGSSTTQNTSWNTILSGAGTRSFGGNIPSAGVSPNDGNNYFRCTNAQQAWSAVFGSSPYGTNNWRISARTPSVANNSSGTAASVEFLVEWIDNYVDPGIAAMPPSTPIQTATPATFPPDDSVDGTFTLNVSYLYATGVLEPPGTGNFTVEQPTITISAIAP